MLFKSRKERKSEFYQVTTESWFIAFQIIHKNGVCIVIPTALLYESRFDIYLIKQIIFLIIYVYYYYLSCQKNNLQPNLEHSGALWSTQKVTSPWKWRVKIIFLIHFWNKWSFSKKTSCLFTCLQCVVHLGKLEWFMCLHRDINLSLERRKWLKFEETQFSRLKITQPFTRFLANFRKSTKIH